VTRHVFFVVVVVVGVVLGVVVVCGRCVSVFRGAEQMCPGLFVAEQRHGLIFKERSHRLEEKGER
jgi:hypothetical protein